MNTNHTSQRRLRSEPPSGVTLVASIMNGLKSHNLELASRERSNSIFIRVGDWRDMENGANGKAARISFLVRPQQLPILSEEAIEKAHKLVGLRQKLLGLGKPVEADYPAGPFGWPEAIDAAPASVVEKLAAIPLRKQHDELAAWLSSKSIREDVTVFSVEHMFRPNRPGPHEFPWCPQDAKTAAVLQDFSIIEIESWLPGQHPEDPTALTSWNWRGPKMRDAAGGIIRKEGKWLTLTGMPCLVNAKEDQMRCVASMVSLADSVVLDTRGGDIARLVRMLGNARRMKAHHFTDVNEQLIQDVIASSHLGELSALSEALGVLTNKIAQQSAKEWGPELFFSRDFLKSMNAESVIMSCQEILGRATEPSSETAGLWLALMSCYSRPELPDVGPQSNAFLNAMLGTNAWAPQAVFGSRATSRTPIMPETYKKDEAIVVNTVEEEAPPAAKPEETKVETAAPVEETAVEETVVETPPATETVVETPPPAETKVEETVEEAPAETAVEETPEPEAQPEPAAPPVAVTEHQTPIAADDVPTPAPAATPVAEHQTPIALDDVPDAVPANVKALMARVAAGEQVSPEEILKGMQEAYHSGEQHGEEVATAILAEAETK